MDVEEVNRGAVPVSAGNGEESNYDKTNGGVCFVSRGEFSICRYIKPSASFVQCHSNDLSHSSDSDFNLRSFVNQRTMSSNIRIALLLLVTSLMVMPIVARLSEKVGVCIRNCAQCKQMFGAFFDGQKCADFCIKYKGKFIPDAIDEDTLMPFLVMPDSDI